MAKEQIIAAAVRWRGHIFALPAPARHHDCIRLMAEEYPEAFVQPEDQGFITSKPRFVGRRVGKVIAREAGQLLPKASNLDDLFSEDVWEGEYRGT